MPSERLSSKLHLFLFVVREALIPACKLGPECCLSMFLLSHVSIDALLEVNVPLLRGAVKRLPGLFLASLVSCIVI